MTASGSSTSDGAVGDRVAAGRVTPERAVAISAIRLMQGVVYQESDAWDDLVRHQGAVRDHFAVVGLEVVVDDDEGYAYLRTADTPEGENALPRVIRRRTLTYADSLLLVLLRKRLAEFESAGDPGQLVLTHDEIVEMIQLFLHRSTDEAREQHQIDASINRLVGMGFLRQLKDRKGEWEVRRILKAYVDAETLSDFSAKLAEYAEAGAADEGVGHARAADESTADHPSEDI
ncbi:putative cytoplasmic protein [Dietzia cinnamea P4]|nr:putative cytoplasmic protein [Dietzia cinnamea P4]